MSLKFEINIIEVELSVMISELQKKNGALKIKINSAIFVST